MNTIWFVGFLIFKSIIAKQADRRRCIIDSIKKKFFKHCKKLLSIPFEINQLKIQGSVGMEENKS